MLLYNCMTKGGCWSKILHYPGLFKSMNANSNSQWSLHAVRTNIDIGSILCIYCTQQKSRTWSPKIQCVINHHNGSKPISMTVTFNFLPTGISRFLPFKLWCQKYTTLLHSIHSAFNCMHLPCRHCHWLELTLNQQLCYRTRQQMDNFLYLNSSKVATCHSVLHWWAFGEDGLWLIRW